MSRLYVVAISHLDTQWRWTVRETIERHLPKTLRQCFDRFARYPGWVLSFDGAFRYRLIEEYYPEDFARLGEWVRRGRWGIAGAWLDAADVNLPSPESLVRQALYGVRYFSRRFGVRPRDVFLPDCFGFGWALPSIAAHCGLVGFSSQKLSKGRAAEPIPFALGRWVGADGAEIVAALEPGGYGEPLEMPANGEPVGLRYFGVGDTGGAPDEESIRRLEAALAAPVPDVRTGPAGRLFADLEPREIAVLPRYSGELLLNLHGSGCYTSRAVMKRWNRRNQVLARSAEAACAAADWLGGLAYPAVELRRAWERFLWHQFHDDLTGTSVPEAYEISENDERLSANQFARLLEAAVGAIARGLDTRAQGDQADPLVVWNPLEFARREIVEAEVTRRAGRPRVFDGADEVPAQLVDVGSSFARIAFLADVPATGCAVFHVRWDEDAASPEGAAFPTVEIDGEGRLARIPGGLLRRPVELELLADTSWRFPSWEIRREDLGAPPRERVAGPATVRPTETGPARLAWEVRRGVGRSIFVDTVRVAAGGDLVEIESTIDWRRRGRLLKLSVEAALERPVARYDLGLGAIERGVNSDRLWEVPAQAWADLSSADGARGLSVFTDCKHGWDRPEPATLRLTLLHTPRVGRRFRHQGRQDLGRHRHRWALWPHGPVSLGEIARRAARFEHPLVAFRAAPHRGALGRRFSFFELADGEALLMALKKTEDGDRLLVRLRETAGRPALGRLRFAAPIVAASETNGVEEAVDAGASLASDTPQFDAGSLMLELRRFQPRSALVTLRPPPEPVAPIASSVLRLPPGDAVATWNRDRRAADFDGRGRSYPAELLPERLIVDGVAFDLSGRLALACRRQSIALPPGGGPRRLHLLAAAASTDAVEAEVRWGDGASRLTVPSWTGIAADLRPTVAWVGTHRHRRRGDDAYHFCYLWRLALAIPPGASAVRLPDDERIRLFAAATLDDPNGGVERASDLYDGGEGQCHA